MKNLILKSVSTILYSFAIALTLFCVSGAICFPSQLNITIGLVSILTFGYFSYQYFDILKS